MMTDMPVEDWKVYLKWNLINHAAPLPQLRPCGCRTLIFMANISRDVRLISPGGNVFFRSEDYALGEAIGQMFVKEHFPPEAKERMLDLVGNLKLALGERIKGLDWMSEVTKKQALVKLAAMNVKIGYPDKWRDYSGLEVQDDSYYNNIKRACPFQFPLPTSIKLVNPSIRRLGYDTSDRQCLLQSEPK